MKQIFFYLLAVSVSGLFLSSCILGQGGESDSLLIAKSAIDSEEKKRRERERSDNRGDCGDYRECEDVCEDVYNDEGDRENEGKVEKCLDLPYKKAISFEDILDILEEPYYDDLTNIEPRDFEAFLEISVAPWVEKTKRLNNDESESLLRWIARESKVASSIVSAYENLEDYDLYEGMQKLFAEIAPDLGSSYTGTTAQDRAVRRCAEFCSAVADESLAQDQSFWDIVDSKNNISGREIACDILKLKCEHNPSIISSVLSSHCPPEVQSENDDGCGL
ncbi:MAG: hypothetical protein OXJ52_08740 [Oligoflexia bacterium]|nr:hypothetical protein [Oligoflexia bacterium]